MSSCSAIAYRLERLSKMDLGSVMQSKIAILGQMEVRSAGHALPLGPPKQRAVFATLLVRPGQVVPVEHIADAVWPAGAPAGMRNQVHVYISSIRRLLARVDGFSGAVHTESSVGYSIELDRSELDLLAFEDRVAAAQRLLASGRLYEAADEFRAALALWRGPALGGVPGGIAQREAARLEERRIAVLEQHLDLRSALGRHGWIIAELTELVEHWPLHEGLRRRLMLALYRTGRSADALAVFREGRHLLVEKLGVEPGPELQSAHQTILSGTAPQGSYSPVDQHVKVDVAAGHMQLPAGSAGLVGRDKELAEIGLLLGSNDQRCTVLVTGAVGVGKTALAVSAARQSVGLFPGGVFYAELGGRRSHPPGPAQVLAELLQAVRVAPPDIPDGLTARSAAFRAELTGRKALVVLDDAINSDQVEPLLPHGTEYSALITSSASLPELQCARIDLAPLAATDARRLLAEIAGASRVDDEAENAEVLVELCDRLPLTVRGIAAKLAARPHWRLAQAVEALCAPGNLDEMSASDLGPRDRLMRSYQRLGERAQRTLRLISRLDLPDFPCWVIAALLDEADSSATVDAVDELVDLHMLKVIPRDDSVRYRLSNVVRAFMLEKNGDDESLVESEPALFRAMDGYIDLAVRANARVTTDFVGMVEPAPFSWRVSPTEAERSLRSPLDWFDIERVGLRNLIPQLVSIGDFQRAGRLSCALSTFFEIRNLFDDWRRSHELVLTAASRDEASHVAAGLHRGLGELWTIQDRYDHAITHFRAALRRVENTQHIGLWAAALAGMGHLFRLTGDYESALQHFHRAAELFVRTGNQAGDAYATIGMGIVYLENNQLDRAHAHFTDGLVISKRIGYRPGIAQGLRALGQLSLRQGQRQDAAAYFERARSYSASLNDRLGIAHAELWLGVVRIEQGVTQHDTTLLTGALSTYREFDNLFGQACALDALSRASRAAGQGRQAMAQVVEATWIWRRINSRYRLAMSLDLLAALSNDFGDHERAHAAAHESRSIRASLKLPEDATASL